MQSVPPPAAAATADAPRGDDGAATTPLDGEKSHQEEHHEQDLDMNELFGSSDSDEDDGGGERGGGGEREEEREEGEPRPQPTEGDDDERMLKSSSPPPALPPPMRIPTSLHDALPPSRNRLAKLPASVRIVQEAFREEGFEGDDREGVDVRWRYGLDERGGTALVRESNARVVTWSDGSQTLHVGGNAAVYNVKAIDIDKDETFLYANVQRLIQCQGKLRDKLMFNPISVKHAASRPKGQSAKSIKVKQTATLVDPVKASEAKRSEEEARIREKEKLLEKQKQMQRNAILNDPNFARRRYQGTRGLSAAFLEEEDEGGEGGRIVNEDDYDEDDGWLLGDDDDDDDELEDAADEVAEAGDDADDDVDVDIGGDASQEGDAGRTMPSAEAEQRNEAALMNILAEGKANDQGDGRREARPSEPKKRKVLISSDSDDDE